MFWCSFLQTGEPLPIFTLEKFSLFTYYVAKYSPRCFLILTTYFYNLYGFIGFANHSILFTFCTIYLHFRDLGLNNILFLGHTTKHYLFMTLQQNTAFKSWTISLKWIYKANEAQWAVVWQQLFHFLVILCLLLVIYIALLSFLSL